MSKTFNSVPNNTAANWWQDASLRKNVACAVVLYWGNFAIGYDGSYFNGLQSLPTFNEAFDYPSGNRLGLISAVSYLPSLALMPLYAISCDVLGRKKTAWIGCLLVLAGALIGTFAKEHTDSMLMAGRALVGMGGSLLTVCSSLLVNELLHPRLRPVGAAFVLVFYYVGAIVSAWVSYGVIAAGMTSSWSWRLPTLLQVVGPAFLFTGLFFTPESPRWLVSRGQHEKAHRILAEHHANGKMDDELVLYELDEITATIALEKEQKTNFFSLFKTPGNRHRVLLLMIGATGSQGNGIAVFSYYLSPVLRLVGVTDARQQTGINGGLMIWNLFFAGLGASLVERFGRRKLWLISTGGMIFTYSGLIGTSGAFAQTQSSSVGLASVAFMFLCYAFYDIAWTPLPYSYSTEILTFSTRASGMALYTWMMNATMCANQWINPIALEAAGWKFYFVFLAALIVLFLMHYRFLVETRGLSLEEIALLFDKHDDSIETATVLKGGAITHVKPANESGDGEDKV
ncbi:hypothetical protein JCM8547_005845 [Rhodosporidiobolus lusitaniae]